MKSEKDNLQFFMDVLARTKIGIQIIGIHHDVQFQNQLLREKFGNFRGQLCYESYWGAKKPCATCPMIEAVKHNKFNRIEILCKDERNYELLSAPFPNRDGTIDKAIIVIRDISKHKESEAKMKHLNMVLHTIRNVNQLITREKDRDRLLQGICNNLIKTRGYYSAWIALFDKSGDLLQTAEAGLGEAFLPMAELLKDGILGLCKDVVKQKEVVVIRDPLLTCVGCPLSQSHVDRWTMRVRLRHNGDIYGLLVVSVPRDYILDQEEQVLLQEVAEDISFALHNIELEEKQRQADEALQQLESQLQRAERMEAIGTLAGGIAHDFNNILGAIMGYTELARMDMPETSRAAAKLDEVLKAGTRAKELVRQILTFSRQTKKEAKPLEVSLVVKEALKLLRASIPTTIEIRKKIATGPNIVMADPTQIHQIVMNLCTNAAQAMQETGGILTIELTGVEIDIATAHQYVGLEPGPYVRISISDTGKGMDPQVRERIFDPFFTTKDPGKGTGLGLSVVHGIVKACKGAITVYSEIGKGSTFHVYLRKIESMKAPEPEKVEALSTGTECILFVDDEEALARLGKETLRELGYDAVCRTSSIEALEAFRAQPERFDLVITDQTMPNMTGKDLAKEIMAIRPGIPVIVCTGYSQVFSEEEANDIGISAFLMKPVSIRELGKTIRQVLDKKDQGRQ